MYYPLGQRKSTHYFMLTSNTLNHDDHELGVFEIHKTSKDLLTYSQALSTDTNLDERQLSYNRK